MHFDPTLNWENGLAGDQSESPSFEMASPFFEQESLLSLDGEILQTM
jgi:hypothetical protein